MYYAFFYSPYQWPNAVTSLQLFMFGCPIDLCEAEFGHSATTSVKKCKSNYRL